MSFVRSSSKSHHSAKAEVVLSRTQSGSSQANEAENKFKYVIFEYKNESPEACLSEMIIVNYPPQDNHPSNFAAKLFSFCVNLRVKFSNESFYREFYDSLTKLKTDDCYDEARKLIKSAQPMTENDEVIIQIDFSDNNKMRAFELVINELDKREKFGDTACKDLNASFNLSLPVSRRLQKTEKSGRLNQARLFSVPSGAANVGMEESSRYIAGARK